MVARQLARKVDVVNIDELNRAIAEKRGDIIGLQTFKHTGHNPSDWIIDDKTWTWHPDYTKWQHCGPLLEELVRQNIYKWYVPHAHTDLAVYVFAGQEIEDYFEADSLPEAIARAWWAWKEQNDEKE